MNYDDVSYLVNMYIGIEVEVEVTFLFMSSHCLLFRNLFLSLFFRRPFRKR